MLVYRCGLYNDSVNSPYLFVSQSSRDNAVAYLNKALKKEDMLLVGVLNVGGCAIISPIFE